MDGESRRGARDDAGQVTTGLLMVMVVLVLVVVLRALLPLAGATDQRSRAQTGADAAALAAVDAFGEGVRDALEPGRPLSSSGRALDALFRCSDGPPAARDYAGRNGSGLVEDQYGCRDRGGRTEVQVEVLTLDRLPGGERSRARARAEMGLSPRPCRLSEDPDALRAAYQAAVAAAAAADTAAVAAQQAAEDAQDAVEEALAQVADGDLDPEVARDLIDRAEEAAQDAADALADAVEDAAGDPPDATAVLQADCGPLGLRVELDLADGGLTSGGLERGDLDDVLEARLVPDQAPV